jgi:hypothetical protein
MVEGIKCELLDTSGNFIGQVKVTQLGSSPPAPGETLVIEGANGQKISAGTYVLDCGQQGRYKVEGPGDSPNVVTNSLKVGVLS